MRMPLLALALLLAPPLAGGVAAQGPCGGAMKAPAVGKWAEWEMPGTGRMRVAVVGTERRDGENHVWIEMNVKGARGGMVMKFLVPRYPYLMEDVKEVIMKPEGRPAMKLPASMVQQMGSQMAGGDPSREFVRRCAAAKSLGPERITVPAGTFTAHHWQDAETGHDVWVTASVPFGLVQSEGKDGTNRMVLVDHGNGATTAITEEPMAMPGMPSR
jgi:hypothetical protein